MSRIELVDLDALHSDIGNEIEHAVLRVLRSGRLVGGPEVAAFEQAFAGFLGVDHAVALANGTDALQIALLACGVTRGDEVLVPGNTFIATAEAVVAVGARPRFVDVARDTGLIDLASAEERLSGCTRAIVPVHLYGRMVDMTAVLDFAARHGLLVIEDAAQAHGAERVGCRAGTLGDAGCFSFYPGKNLGAVGDAGAAVTNNEGIAERMRLYRDHGRRGRDEHEIPGLNSRMDPIQAAVLSAKLPYLPAWTRARRKLASHYRESLGCLLDPQDEDPSSEVHHLLPILLEDRDELARRLGERGISTGVHYRRAIPATTAFAGSLDRCPAADFRANRQLSLPMHPYLSEGEIGRVIDAVHRHAPVAA